MTKEELEKILELHKKWLSDEPDGVCANLCGANLSGANLSGANLSFANLSDADLRGANLSGANLYDASGVEVWRYSIVPQVGSFTMFKKVRSSASSDEYYIARLEVPESAKRSNAPGGRKIRVNKAEVIEFLNLDRSLSEVSEARSLRDVNFKYMVSGEMFIPDFDDDPSNECSTGIHGFLSFEEAREFSL